MIALEDFSVLRHLKTEIDYDNLEEYSASKQTFVTISDEKEEEQLNMDNKDINMESIEQTGSGRVEENGSGNAPDVCEEVPQNEDNAPDVQ